MSHVLFLLCSIFGFIWLFKWAAARQHSADAQAALEQIAKIQAYPEMLARVELVAGDLPFIRYAMTASDSLTTLPFVQNEAAVRLYEELQRIAPSAQFSVAQGYASPVNNDSSSNLTSAIP